MATCDRTGMEIGSEVGSRRWPDGGGGTYGKPWRGVLLSPLDPRAWAGTLAFPRTSLDSPPPADAVAAHVARCDAYCEPGTSVPILWDFGPSGFKVYWESASRVRPYAEDCAAWRVANAEAEARLAEMSRAMANRHAMPRLYVA